MSGIGNGLAVRDSAPVAAAALAIQPGQLTWDKFQEAALNQIGLKNAGNADRAVFLHQCQRTGLDPFAKQIMMIERREKQGDNWVSKWTIQTGIEGWRTIRDRAEKREGLRGILSRFTYYDADDNEKKVWARPEPPAVVEVTYTVVEAGGREVPYTSQLRFAEYVQTKQDKDGRPYRVAQWKDKPVHMLEKCAEADVYRKAFPQDYSGVDLTDAMPPVEAYDEPLPQRARVSAGQARQRLQTVTALAEPVTEDVPPAGEQPAPPPAAPHAPPQSAGGTPGDERHRKLVGAAQQHFKRLGYTDADKEARLRDATTLVLGEDVPAVGSFSDLTHGELEDLNGQAERCKNRAALQALLAAGEVHGE